MNCYDCSTLGRSEPATAVCMDCGAGICGDHAVEHHQRVATACTWNHLATTYIQQRRIRCIECATAMDNRSHPRRRTRDPRDGHQAEAPT